MAVSTKPSLFESENIASLTLYKKAPLYTRADLIPFIVGYALCVNVYINPQIYKDLVQGLLDVYVADYAHWNFQVYAWSLVGLWLVIIVSFFHVITGLLEYWHLWIRCKIQYAEVQVIFFFIFFMDTTQTHRHIHTYTHIYVHCIYMYKTQSIDDCEVAHVIPPLHCGEDALCKLETSKERDQLFFIFQQMKYIFNDETGKFEELKFPTNEKIDYYCSWTGFRNSHEINDIRAKYGYNEFNIPMPNFWDVFQEHATAPFFLFQIFCVGLWCLDEYWMYSLFTLFMLVVFEMMMVKRRMGNMKLVRNMRAQPIPVHVYREAKWIRIMSKDVLPGDIMSLARGKITKEEDLYDIHNKNKQSNKKKATVVDTIVPCDILLLSGSCVLDEALLTGESVPQIKEPVDISDSKSN